MLACGHLRDSPDGDRGITLATKRNDERVVGGCPGNDNKVMT
jgi:hypothetical protein